MPAMIVALLLVAAPCPPVQVTAAGKPAALNAKLVGQVSANFARAYAKACSEGLMKKPLAAGGKLFLVNAPDANVASIYTSGRKSVLEYWFVTHDGKRHLPSVKDLHEAIYCAAHGASAKEQEESGRCLPD
jgi:hypothetical protein